MPQCDVPSPWLSTYDFSWSCQSTYSNPGMGTLVSYCYVHFVSLGLHPFPMPAKHGSTSQNLCSAAHIQEVDGSPTVCSGGYAQNALHSYLPYMMSYAMMETLPCCPLLAPPPRGPVSIPGVLQLSNLSLACNEQSFDRWLPHGYVQGSRFQCWWCVTHKCHMLCTLAPRPTVQ